MTIPTISEPKDKQLLSHAVHTPHDVEVAELSRRVEKVGVQHMRKNERMKWARLHLCTSVVVVRSADEAEGAASNKRWLLYRIEARARDLYIMPGRETFCGWNIASVIQTQNALLYLQRKIPPNHSLLTRNSRALPL